MIEQKAHVSTSLLSLGNRSKEIGQHGLVGGQCQESAGLYQSQLCAPTEAPGEPVSNQEPPPSAACSPFEGCEGRWQGEQWTGVRERNSREGDRSVSGCCDPLPCCVCAPPGYDCVEEEKFEAEKLYPCAN